MPADTSIGRRHIDKGEWEEIKTMARTIIGLYDDFADAQATMNDLLASCLSRDEVSLIANNSGERFAPVDTPKTNEAGLSTSVAGGAAEGAVIGGLTALAASLVVMLLPGVGPILAVGPLATALSGAGIGAVGGGLIGGLASADISEEEAGYFAEGVRRGGALVLARVSNEDCTSQVEDILRRRNPVDMTERGGYYRATGYAGYNADSPHMTPEEIDAEAERRAAWRASAPTVPPSSVGDARAFDDPDELMYEDELAGSGRLSTARR